MHSQEAVAPSVRRALAQLLRRRLHDLLGLMRQPPEDLDLPKGAATRRAQLRAAAQGDLHLLPELCAMPSEAFERSCLEAFWTRREYVSELHFRQLGPAQGGPAGQILSRSI